MKRSIQAVALSSVFMLAFSLGSAQQEYTLKLNLKEGDTFKYKMSMDIDFGGQGVNASTTVTQKVVKVEENGNIVMESSTTDLIIKFGDAEMPQPAQPPTRITYKPNGDLATSGMGGGPTSQIMGSANYIFPDKPVKVGDKWNHTLKGQNGMPDMNGEFELVGVEKLGETEVVRIKVTWRQAEAKENAMSAEGFVLVNPTNGMAHRFEFKLKGLPVEGAPAPLDGALKMELIP
ncbi:MAG: hypothetical protein SNJ72_06565 [Fimbriimonadales bacterium]